MTHDEDPCGASRDGTAGWAGGPGLPGVGRPEPPGAGCGRWAHCFSQRFVINFIYGCCFDKKNAGGMKGCAVSRFPWLRKSTVGAAAATHVTAHVHTHTRVQGCSAHFTAPLDPVQGTRHHTPLRPVKGHSGLFSERAVPASELPPGKCQGVAETWILVGRRHGHLETLSWLVSQRDHHPGAAGQAPGSRGSTITWWSSSRPVRPGLQL